MTAALLLVGCYYHRATAPECTGRSAEECPEHCTRRTVWTTFIPDFELPDLPAETDEVPLLLYSTRAATGQLVDEVPLTLTRLEDGRFRVKDCERWHTVSEECFVPVDGLERRCDSYYRTEAWGQLGEGEPVLLTPPDECFAEGACLRLNLEL